MPLKVCTPPECLKSPTFTKEGNGEYRVKLVAEANAVLKRGLSGE